MHNVKTSAEVAYLKYSERGCAVDVAIVSCHAPFPQSPEGRQQHYSPVISSQCGFIRLSPAACPRPYAPSQLLYKSQYVICLYMQDIYRVCVGSGRAIYVAHVCRIYLSIMAIAMHFCSTQNYPIMLIYIERNMDISVVVTRQTIISTTGCLASMSVVQSCLDFPQFFLYLGIVTWNICTISIGQQFPFPQRFVDDL